MIKTGSATPEKKLMATRFTDTPAPVAARELFDLGLSRAAVMHTLVVQFHLTNREAANVLRSTGIGGSAAGSR
jgi:hypothetical protein